MILFWENGTLFRSARIFSNWVILCPLFSQLHSSPTGATALFPVGQKAEPDVVTPNLMVHRVSERNSNLDTWLKYIFTSCGKVPLFLLSLYKFEAVPLVSLGCRWKPICEWACRRMGAWAPVAVDAACASPAPQPRPLPRPLLCAMLSVGLHICTRKRIPQEEFALASPRNILYWPKKGFESPSAQVENFRVVAAHAC